MPSEVFFTNIVDDIFFTPLFDLQDNSTKGLQPDFYWGSMFLLNKRIESCKKKLFASQRTLRIQYQCFGVLRH